MARLIVRDVANEKSKTYECRVNILQTYMQFFTPYIALQMKKHAIVNNGKGHNTNWCVKLQVSCDLEIFDLVWRWMFNDLANCPCGSHAPSSSSQNVIINMASRQYLPDSSVFTVENVVSVALCANFLHINKLLEQTLLYFREHVSEICLSNVNLSCIPGDLLGRISGYVKAAHLATALQKMYETHAERHPNRSFITSLLRHILIEELSHTSAQSCLLAIKAEQKNITSCAEKEERQQEVLHKKEENQEYEEEELENESRQTKNYDSKCAYQWCTLCGVLFNKTDIELLTHQFTWEPPCCPALPSLYTDDKGHKLITHCTLTVHENQNKKRDIKTNALRWLKQYLCANQSAQYGKVKSNNSAQGVKKCAGDKEDENIRKEKKNLAMELFCWKLYGTITYVVCTSCNHLLPLIDNPNHFLQCTYNINETSAAVPEYFIWPDGTIMQSVERQSELSALLDWYNFAEREGVYDALTNSLEPLRCHCSSNSSNSNKNNISSVYELPQGQQQMLNHEREYKSKEHEEICGEETNELERYAEVKKKVAMHQEHLLPNAKTSLTYSWSKQTNHVLCHVLPMLCEICSSNDDGKESVMENEHHSKHDHKGQQNYETKYNEQQKCNIIDQMMHYERNMQMTLTKEMSKAQHFSFDELCHVDDQVDSHGNNKRLCSLKENAICLVPSLPYTEMRHKSRKNRLHFVSNTRSNYTTSSPSTSKAIISLAHRHRLNTL